MGTSAFIGIQRQDGSVRGIYCHYDGYLAHVRPILTEHYNSPDEINKLIDLGNLNKLGTKLGRKHMMYLKDAKSASRDEDFRNFCSAFIRDNEEPIYEHEPKSFQNASDFAKAARKQGMRFTYLFHDKWVYLENDFDWLLDHGSYVNL